MTRVVYSWYMAICLCLCTAGVGLRKLLLDNPDGGHLLLVDDNPEFGVHKRASIMIMQPTAELTALGEEYDEEEEESERLVVNTQHPPGERDSEEEEKDPMRPALTRREAWQSILSPRAAAPNAATLSAVTYGSVSTSTSSSAIKSGSGKVVRGVTKQVKTTASKAISKGATAATNLMKHVNPKKK